MSEKCPITMQEYGEAVEAITNAQEQMIPDGRNCMVCGDSGHQAWECHHNPIVMMRRARTTETEFRCFHCGDVFTTEESAHEHFGCHESNIPQCLELHSQLEQAQGELEQEKDIPVRERIWNFGYFGDVDDVPKTKKISVGEVVDFLRDHLEQEKKKYQECLIYGVELQQDVDNFNDVVSNEGKNVVKDNKLLTEDVVRLHEEKEQLREENNRLKAIVDKLPKTADGVTIVPGMDLWQLETRNAGKTWNIVFHKIKGVLWPEIFPFPGGLPSRCYSTHEAADAALKERSKEDE